MIIKILQIIPQAKEVFDQLRQKFEDGSITLDDYKQAREYDLIKVHRPTLAQNLTYFVGISNWILFCKISHGIL